MVITSNNQKQNLGLNLKFEGRGLKVINYSKKDGKFWEFSEKAVELIRDYKVLFLRAINLQLIPLMQYLVA